jgi:PAS domain S-box-containing protein
MNGACFSVGQTLDEASKPEGPPVLNRHCLEALLEGSNEQFAILDLEGVIKFTGGAMDARFADWNDGMVGRNAAEFLQPRNLERGRAFLARCLSTKGITPPEDFWLERPDGSGICLHLVLNNLLDDPAIAGIVLTGRRITEQVNLERTRAYASAANSVLVNANDETDLLNRLCEVVVEDSSYHLAWVGFTDPSRPLGVRLVASGGNSSAYIEALEVLAGNNTYPGPFAYAIETREPFVIQDLAAMPEVLTWQSLALDHGYRALLALPLFLNKTDYGVLAVYSERPHVFTPDTVRVLIDLAKDIAYGIDSLRSRKERAILQARFDGSISAAVQAVVMASELRDPYTAGHQRQVAHLAGAIAVEMGIDPEVIAGIRVGASIHDVGKLIVPAEILSKPGPLKEAEMNLVKLHPQAGCDIVSGIEFPWPVPEMLLQHHERLDGSGYPHGLRGDAIVIDARIIAVADIVEAMSSDRPYRPALGIEVALATVREGRNTLFDPAVVEACCLLFEEKGFSFSRHESARQA